LQLGLRVGGHLALTDFHSEDQERTLALCEVYDSNNRPGIIIIAIMNKQRT